jgi:glycosyltransferase involved in cell wall biosynthesis
MTESIASEKIRIEYYPATKKNLRVAFVTETYPPEINGVAITIERLVNGLRSENHDIQLVRPRHVIDAGRHFEEGYQPVLTRGFPIPRYPELRMGAPASGLLTRCWKDNRPDLVHIATEGPLGWSALKVARKLNIPTTSDFRTNFDVYSRHYGVGWLKRPIGAYLKRFHNLTQCTMVPTAELGEELTRRGFHNVKVVARGVDTNLFNSKRRSTTLRQQWGVEEYQPVVLSVGRLAPEKNLSLLVQTYHQMKSSNPDIRLVIVGDGPSRDMIRKACPDAIFAGVQTGDVLATHYASADIFLFPSLSETYGNVTLEALASGLACVAFNYAAASERIRNGVNGLLAPCDEAHLFVDHAVKLASDDAQRLSLRLNAEQSVVPFDWKKIIGEVETTWIDLLGRHAVSQSTTKSWPANGAPV